MSCERGGEGEEVMAMVEEGEERWEKVLPLGSLRVLLVEGDDSTRQVIAALLRKSSYKVVAVSDGMKAWEMLKEKPHSIDLVLAEVDAPSIPGLDLLTMIMDHETCKNIPVIMMSSHDSISMVFKCMLQGAVDFLVKPLRKNELRNLWQHVWRRQSMSGSQSSSHARQEENLAKQKLEANSGKQGVSAMQNNMECSDKGSDAQSSCTRSDVEVESTYKQNMLELKHPVSRGLSLFDDAIGQIGKEQIQLNSSLTVHQDEAKDKSYMFGSDTTLFKQTCMRNEHLLEDHSCAVAETTYKDAKPYGSIDNKNIMNEKDRKDCDQYKTSEEVVDLMGAIDNQPHYGYLLRDKPPIQSRLSDAPEVVFHYKDIKCKRSSAPFLDLSLRRHQYSDEQENDYLNTLNHSDTSPFSLYSSKTTSFQDEGEEHCRAFKKPKLHNNSINSSNTLRWDDSMPNLNMEHHAKLPFGGLPSEDETEFNCSPLQVIPLPIPAGGLNFDSLSATYSTVMQPILYPESSAFPLWSNMPFMWHKAIQKDPSQHSDLNDLDSMQSHQSHGQSSKSSVPYSEQRREMNLELKDEQRPFSSVIGDRESSSICNGSSDDLNKNAYGCYGSGGDGNETTTNISKPPTQIGNEGKKPTDFYQLSQREAALNKFRLKRKERCFEKKVRYQSRKRLAEQRPRVKGQFVRHVQPDHPL